MSLAVFAQEETPTGPPPRKCQVCYMAAGLTADEVKGLENLLRSRRTVPNLQQIIHEKGFDYVQQSSINRHRKGGCANQKDYRS